MNAVPERVVARNIFWNYAGMAATMTAGFVTAPFLINRLGSTTYGLWILIGSFTGYFGLLDLGVRGSIGRFMAFHRGRQDHDAVNEILSTALAFLCIPAGITVLGTMATAFVFFFLFDVPPDETLDVRTALIIVGVNLAVSFPLSAYDSTLWALQRFDAINLVDIVVVAVRTILTFFCVSRGGGLVSIAVLMLAATLATATAKGMIAHRLAPRLSIALRHVCASRGRELFGYSFWYLLLSMNRMFTSQLSRLLIGSCLGPALVTPFSIAASVIGYGNALLVAWTGVLAPVATAYHAGDQHDRQRRLYLRGSRFCTYFAFVMLGGYLFLGHPFLSLWVGKDVGASFSVLVVLAIGELLPMAQSVAGNILLGVARHKFVAATTLMEAAICATLTAALIHYRDLVGPALAVAVAGGLCRGILIAVYACRVIGCTFGEYLRHSFIPPMFYALPVVGALGMATVRFVPGNWLEFVIYSAAYIVVCGGIGAALMRIDLFREPFYSSNEQAETFETPASVISQAAGAPTCR
jgi:O-antigen/teichoic acid export membrane protein